MAAKRKMHRRFDLARVGEAGWLSGVDEAGRGCLAGPVVAGAVLVERGFYDGAWCKRMAREVDDSKKLSPDHREAVFDTLPKLLSEGTAYIATGQADAREVDLYNILGATKLAMRRALADVGAQSASRVRMPEKGRADGLFALGVTQPATALVIVDGLPLKAFPYDHTAYIGGDGKSLVIALASIIAKVTRDRMITALDANFPQYGFAQHKGYGTEQHREALHKYGPCELHRATFIAKMMNTGPQTSDAQNVFSFA